MPTPIRRLSRTVILLAVAWAALAASALSADDGVIEINQTRAEAGGVTPGDGPGFPVSITQPGSYRLTSNLDYSGISGAENLKAVEILAKNVVLDLNGFSILGPTTCTGTPVTSCSPTGTGAGIDVPVTTAGSVEADTVIRNGIVRGAGGDGVQCQRGCVVENLHAVENGDAGVVIANNPGTIRNVTARRNGETGIWASGPVSGCLSHGNRTYGIVLNGNSLASGNVVTQNGGNGIRCAADVAVDNVIANNAGSGIEIGNGCGYGRNVLIANTGGHTTGAGGIQTDINVCGSAPCP